ncbi:unnamed protein product, partial [Mesorhabditis belari]|uniref:Protein kinase domain-containing protein n=1 Tax=Mesorhabditis belari TaxID=2138241 RepID=A0AAF3E9W5_9BILA
MSRWLFLVLLFRLSSQQVTFLELSRDDGNVLGLASDFGTIAVAAKKRIFLYRDTGQDSMTLDTQIGIIKLEDGIEDSLLEFKLVDRDSLLLCDKDTCRLCALNATCTELKRERRNSKNDLLFASAVKDGQKIFVRAIDKRNMAWVSAYLLDRNGDELEPFQTSDDLSHFKKTGLSSSFSKDGFVYFVGSSQSRFEPFIFENQDVDKTETGLLRLSRLCTRDGTKLLESKIEIALSCGDLPKQGGEVNDFASYFDPSEEILYVAASNQANSSNGSNQKTYVVCQFPYAALQQRFDNVWQMCQSTSKEEADACKSWADPNNLPDHCYVFAKSDGYSQRCSRFQGPTSESTNPLANCDLAGHDSTAYRYGSLSDYRPLLGVAINVLMGSDSNEISQVIPDHHGSLFFSNFQGSIFRTSLANIAARVTWSKNNTSDNLHRIALSSLSDTVYYSAPNKVMSLKLNCDALFHSCEDLLVGGFTDALRCGWCPNEDGKPSGQVLALDSNRFECSGQILRGVCPPVIQYVGFDSSKNSWNLYGKNLGSMIDPRVLICSTNCTPVLESGERMQCKLSAPSQKDFDTCDVVMTGKVGDSKMRIYRPPVKDEGSQAAGSGDTTGKDDKNKGMSRTSKALIAIFSVIGILVFIAIILWYARKTYMNNQNRKHMNEDFTMGGIYNPTVVRRWGAQLESHPLNVYGQHHQNGLQNGNGSLRDHDPFSPYEQISRDIDPKLKIELRDIKLETQIGKGHYGIVFRGEYCPSENFRQKVACKMLQHGVPGVREFVNEGLLMSKFDHPRVMRLIGIAFDQDFTPIIVTEYMSNGDLLKFVKDPNKHQTLRSFLNFAVQISEGMEYLHQKNFIHRDLAARNCMLDDFLNVKIADFGLCRELSNFENYEVLHRNRDLPLRWMPIEALTSQIFTQKGDVWAYGVVLWELMTRGQMPYTGIANFLVQPYLASEERLPQPRYCPPRLYDYVMLSCWAANPEDRPTFTELTRRIKQVVEELEQTQRQKMSAVYEQVTPLRTSQNDSAALTPTTGQTMLGEEAEEDDDLPPQPIPNSTIL